MIKSEIIRESLLRSLYRKLKNGTLRMLPLTAKAGAFQTRSDLTQRMANKMQRWFVALSVLQSKENDVISEITAIEERHKKLRAGKALHVATPSKAKTLDPEEEDKPSRPWLWLLLFYWLLRKQPARGFFLR